MEHGHFWQQDMESHLVMESAEHLKDSQQELVYRDPRLTRYNFCDQEITFGFMWWDQLIAHPNEGSLHNG